MGKWWIYGASKEHKSKGGHHPNEIIPMRIWSLGSGTPKELEQKYIEIYGNPNINNVTHIPFGKRKFNDWLRELIKQKLFVEIL